jgi:hypothetical protein
MPGDTKQEDERQGDERQGDEMQEEAAFSLIVEGRPEIGSVRQLNR